MQLGDFGAQLHAHFGVEIGERSSEEKNFWLANNRAPHRHTLAGCPPKALSVCGRASLRSRECSRALDDPFLDFRLWIFSQLQSESEIVGKTFICG